MATNQSKHNDIHYTLTGGEQGVKEAGPVYVAVTSAARDAAKILDTLTPGKAGVRSAGLIVGMLARIESNTAVTQNLVKALAAVAGGESFDQEKLLAGISKAVFDNSKAGAEAGTAAAIKAIDTTVTIEQESAK